MARKFTSFDNFVGTKKEENGSIDESAEVAKAKLDINNKIAELKKKQVETRENDDKIGMQILDIDIKLAQLDLQKNDLQAQKVHLAQVKKISDENKKAAEEAAKEKEKK